MNATFLASLIFASNVEVLELIMVLGYSVLAEPSNISELVNFLKFVSQ